MNPANNKAFCLLEPYPARAFFECLGPGGRGGGVESARRNSKTIHCIEMKFGRVVKNHKLLNFI